MHRAPTDLSHVEIRQDPRLHCSVVSRDTCPGTGLEQLWAQALDDKPRFGFEDGPIAMGGIEPNGAFFQFWEGGADLDVDFEVRACVRLCEEPVEWPYRPGKAGVVMRFA